MYIFNVIHLLFNFTFFSEPKTGFKIAFNMFDADGNEFVDKNEFLVVRAFSDCFTFPVM